MHSCRLLCVVFVCFASFLHGQSPALPPKEKFHLFLLVGQSNMAGRGVVAPADNQPHPRVLMLNKAGEWVPATDPLHFDKPAALGLGRTFATDVAAASAPDVVIGLFPCAVVGSPMDAWKTGFHYQPTQRHPWDDALRRAKLPALIAAFRTELVAPTAPFVVGQLGQFAGSPWSEFKTAVDRVHRELPQKIPHSAFVSSDGLKDTGDKTHFDSPSYREFGHRYAAGYLRLVSE